MDEAMGDSSTSLPVLSASEQQAVGPPVYCQVLGCSVLLTGGKTYCIKKRTCTTHIQAESVSLSEDSSTLHRFCQQCGKFEAIHKFDGTKRSCRARLAKRRSGTRALLQKKGCKDSHPNGSDQCGTAAVAAAAAAGAKASSCSQHTDIYPQDEAAGFSAQQQLLMMYGHQNSNEALLHLLSLPDDAGADAAPGMLHSSSSDQVGAPARSLSDGTPIAAASAAAAAAAANTAAAAAAHQAISAPLYLLARSGTGVSDAADRPSHAHAAAAAGAGGGCAGGEDGLMGQAELLKALQAQDDPSDPLQRIHGSATSAVGAAGALTPPPVGGYPVEHTSCSVPLAQLDLGSSGALPKAVLAPGSPMRSAGGPPCKSAPLAGLQAEAAFMQGIGRLVPQQRQTSLAGQQQQGGSMDRAGSRLKWLIQQLQQELDVCNPAELEALNNDELGTLLCAALAPATSNAAALAAAAGDDAAAAARGGAHARPAAAAVAVKPDPAAASYTPMMPPAQPGFSAGFGPASMVGPSLGPLPGQVSELDLHLQKAQVQQLQQRVQQLQMQLQMKDTSRLGGMQCATPPPPPAGSNCPADMTAVYRSMSGMPDSQGCGNMSASMQQQQQQQQQQSLDSLLFGPGAGAVSMSAALQTAMRGPQHMPAAASRPMDPSAAQWMTHSMSQPMCMPGLSHAGQLQQQRLQQVQQQAMSLQMAAASAGVQRQPDAAAAMQFMALQSQLRLVEDEMLLLMAQQSAAAR